MKEKGGKEFLEERSQAILGGVVGLVLALGAYDLMSISVVNWSQLFMFLGFSFTTLVFILFMWYIGSEALDLVPHDSQLFGLNIVLVVLLAVLPFSARLSLYSDARELGAKFLVLNMGIIFTLTAIINLLVLRKPESRLVPRSVYIDMQAYTFGLPAGALTALLFLFAPLDEVGGPLVDLDIPQRALGLFSAWGVFFLVIIVATVLIRRRTPAPADRVPETQEMGEVFHSKTRTVNNTLFEAALGLSAFSLTDLPVSTTADIIPPLAHFGFLFLLIIVFWIGFYRVYAAIPVWNEWVDFLTTWVPMLVIFAPPIFRLAVLPNPETRELGSAIFPVFTAVLALANAAVYLYAYRLRRRDVTVPLGVVKELHWWAAGSLLLAPLFLASLLIPFDVTVLWHIRLRVVVWWISLLLFVIVMRVASRSAST